MNDFRFKQAQNLIKKSASNSEGILKLKIPQSGHIDVKRFQNILKDIIFAEKFIYSSLPSHKLSQDEAKSFIEFLIIARNNIDSILADFNVIARQKSEINVSKSTDNILFITSKNKFKKVLKKLGVDVQRIIVSNVPLNIHDINEINPKIPKSALKKIKTKIEHLHADIKRKKQLLDPEKVVILAENDLNGYLLGKRAKEYYGAIIYLNNDLKSITDLELIEIIED